jgi:hypothetical protein
MTQEQIDERQAKFFEAFVREEITIEEYRALTDALEQAASEGR